MAGCIVSSLHPLFVEEDRIFDPELVGRWVDPADKTKPSWIFKPRSDKGYDCTLLEKGKAYRFFAGLGKIGDSWFLDLYAERTDKETVGGLHLLPTHSFWKLTLKKDTLTLAPLNYEWFANQVKAKKVDISYTTLDEDRLLLTASSEELRKFFLRHEKNAEAFKERHTWKRQEE